MSKQSTKEIHEFVSLLDADPSQIHLIPTKNTHTPKKKGDNYYRLPYGEIDHRWKEGHLDLTGYDGLKLDLSSAITDKLAYILIDYDDKNNTGSIFKGINPPPTLTIKTPTGAGEQRLYLVSREFTDQLINEKYIIGDNKGPQAEIFVLDGRTKRLIVLPGLKKNSKEYSLKGKQKIAYLDENTKALLLTQNSEIESRVKSRLKNHADKFNSPPDLTENKAAYRRYLRNIADEIIEGVKEPIAQPGRDDKIYSLLCEGATYNLSFGLIADMVISEIIDKTEGSIQVFIDPFGEFSHDQIHQKAKYVAEKITDLRRNNERAFTALVPWPRDPESKLPISISRKQIEERAQHIASRGRKYLHGSSTQQILFIEMIAQESSGFFAIPTYDPAPYYQSKYEETLQREMLSNDIDVDISIIKERPRLTFEQVSPRAFDDTYTFINEKGKHVPLSRHPKFHDYISHGRFEKIKRPDYVKDNVISIYSEPPLVPSETITQERIDKAYWYIRRHFANLLAKDNFEEEFEYHINWFARKVQNPENRNRTILYYSGAQGSGKSVFVNLVGLMMPEDSYEVVTNVKELENQFFMYPSLLFLDEGDIQQKEVLDIIKSVVTADSRKQQEKYKMGRNIALNVDLVVANNHPIPEALDYERRVIPAEGGRAFDTDRVNKEVREFLLEVKKNNWQMGRDIAYILHNKDITDFKTKYEPSIKKNKRFQRAFERNPKLIRSLINLIANCGYVKNTQILIPGERSNTYDLIAAFTIVYTLPEFANGTIDLKKIKIPKFMQLKNVFGNNESCQTQYAHFSENWPAVGTKTSRFWLGISDSSPTGSTFSRLVPPIGKWLDLLTFIIHRKIDDSLRNQIIEQFNLRAQLEWDSITKPNVDNIGYIDKAEEISMLLGEDINDSNVEEEF
jgi:energy-coupling factor transporter ATP-binding protein EcfA2